MGVGPVDRRVDTACGPARIVLDAARRARAALVLGHGAGGGPAGGAAARDLAALAAALPSAGVTVVRVEQPWRVAGKPVAPAPVRLDEGWLGVLAQLRSALPGPLFVGGRSAGARVACRTAVAVGAAGVVALAFPLHPPGRPERSRLPELRGAGVPVLVVQGERDAFGRPAEFPADLDVRAVPDGDHGFGVRRGMPATAATDLVVAHVRDWLLDRLGG